MKPKDQLVTELITLIENFATEEKGICDIAEVESSVTLPMSEPRESFEELIPEQPHPPPPPPPPSSSTTSTTITEVASNDQLNNVETKESLEDLTKNANELSSSSQKDTIVTTDVPTERQSPSLSTVTEITTCSLQPSLPSTPPPPPCLPTKEDEDSSSPLIESSSVKFPDSPPPPPAALSPPSSPQCNISHASGNQTEIVPTSVKSPNPSTIIQSSIVSSTTTATTNDCSQTQLHDDQTDDLKTESVSQSLSSYNDSEVELKDRLAQSLAETENQKDTLSCRSLNDDVSTVFQENHQSTPEVEIPVVEKAVTHEVGTTENNIEEAPKVAPPAIPIEVPASPPSAPAITEDVASVTKAIEEIEISDKAVAAAVNEAIECNTNEIIADAHHQNNMNE
ncbi:hypothetical protein M0804_004654 [Polistes exclamans]|nr:hypothetical protein M0804_004654 [Polistes exclamans]